MFSYPSSKKVWISRWEASRSGGGSSLRGISIRIEVFGPKEYFGQGMQKFLKLKATSINVIPAKAGIHKFLTLLDSRWSLPRT